MLLKKRSASQSGLEFEPGSYRDRTGRVFYDSGTVYRALNSVALDEWENLCAKRFFQRYQAAGKLVRTERLSDTETPEEEFGGGEWAAVLRHQRIPFISYPYEWSFGMLQDAALLHLELLDAAIDE